MPPLLRTKIQLPPIRTHYISRARLTARLRSGVEPDARVTLVSAPAGFGKSSCLIEWAHQLQHEGALVAWYALDEHDNDPARFAAYLLGAFHATTRLTSSLPSASDRIGLQEAISSILNAAIEHDGLIVLILDDYHLISEPLIHDAVSLMAAHLPANLKLAIGTRADPPLQLARQRARGTLTEVRLADLRFRPEEMALWLESVLGWIPSAHLLEQIGTLTEGWAAALALLMMSQPHLDEQGLESQLTRYSQSQRHIFDYFAEEIFEQQPTPIQDFLLDTCVLNWLQPDLCAAMTGRRDATLLLNHLAANSLFVIPLSDVDPIYRYHHLFEQFLRQLLEMSDPARYLEKHRQAAEWHSAHDNVVEAVQHALALEDLAYAADLIEGRAWALLTSRGEIATIVNWLPQFPEIVLRQHPRLCLYFSRALYLTGNLERSAQYVRLASAALDQGETDTSGWQALKAIAANYQATLAAYQGDIPAGRTWIQQAIALRDAVDDLDRARIANTDAYLHYLAGNVWEARRAYRAALEIAQQIDHHYLRLDAHSYLAQIDLQAGDLGAVKERCEAVLAQEPNRIGPLSTLMLPLAQVLYEQNQLMEAEAMLREAISLARQAHIPDVLWPAHVSLADKLLSRGEAAEAELHMVQARSIVAGYRSPLIASFLDAAQARLDLRAGRIQSAADWAASYQQTQGVSYHRDYEDLTLACVLLAQGHYDPAAALLARLIEGAQHAGRISSVITGEILRALVWQTTGKLDAALAACERALHLAQPRGYIRSFLDMGQPVMRLLQRAVDRGPVSAYARRLLDAASQTGDGQRLEFPMFAGSLGLAPPDELDEATGDHAKMPNAQADGLSEQEHNVLRLICAGMSNQEIADELVITLGTAKWHVHNVLQKLEVRNRSQAILRARELGLV